VSQHYSDESREEEIYSLPNVEVFYAAQGELGHNDDGDVYEAGFYFWYCFPGCMPDSEPNGPYDTEDAAIAAMREECSE